MFKNLKKDSINESFLAGVTFKYKKKIFIWYLWDYGF